LFIHRLQNKNSSLLLLSVNFLFNIFFQNSKNMMIEAVFPTIFYNKLKILLAFMKSIQAKF